MAQVDIIVMSNQPSTTYIDLDNPARAVTGAPASRITPAPTKKRRGRPPGSKNRTQPEAAEKETNTDG